VESTVPHPPAPAPSAAFAWKTGHEPIAGYRLLEPLGKGGFGEVWKCEAPGGLHKALKIVRGGEGGMARLELEALQRVKSIRHPFILSLERLEVANGVLVVVMELADKSLVDVLNDCRALGIPGVPRNELLSLLLEAAEALDWMNFVHGLQHLDVKPHNLFVVSNHLKVADFGLVKQLPQGTSAALNPGGLTPLYAAPERLRGGMSRHSDQYSLAIVYQQLCTGTVPFWSSNPQQLMLKHLGGEPDLHALAPADQTVVAKALAKNPDQRFSSCLTFIQALVRGQESPPPSKQTATIKDLAAPTPPPPALQPSLPLPPPTLLDPRLLEAGGATRVVTSSPPPQEIPESLTPPPPTADVRGSPHAVTQVAVDWGYELVEPLGPSVLGDVWWARDPSGATYRALCLHLVNADETLREKLSALQHPQLPPTNVVRGPAGQLIVLTEPFEKSLWDRFEHCRASGQPGVPREELLGYLRSAAEALDALQLQRGAAHLALNPRNLMIDHDQLWITEFGLATLVWQAAGRPLTQLNQRYGAVELLEDQGSSAADQYSLALIYAEMLSGFHPRPRSGSGAHRRPTSGRALPPRAAPKIDLDLLPAPDRAVIGRALDANPRNRYESCTALVRALEGRADAGLDEDELPPVVFSAVLHRAPAPELELPGVEQVVAALASESVLPVSAGPRLPAPGIVAAGVQFEYRYPIRLVPGVTRLKVHGFRKHWNARVAHEDDSVFVFHLNLPAPGPPGSPPVTLEVRLQVRPADGPATGMSESHVLIRPLKEPPPAAARALESFAPRLLDSLRSFLQASPERRAEERWACPQPLRVYPLLASGGLGAPLPGVCKNISRGGVKFLLERALDAEYVYLHWYDSMRAAPYALLARIRRSRPVGGGEGHEIGASFLEAAQ
jgi:serine/threonine protein kinase